MSKKYSSYIANEDYRSRVRSLPAIARVIVTEALETPTAERDSLKARVERLEAALRPFATVARLMAPLVEDQPERWPDRKPNSEFIPGSWPVWADFRSAVEALEDKR